MFMLNLINNYQFPSWLCTNFTKNISVCKNTEWLRLYKQISIYCTMQNRCKTTFCAIWQTYTPFITKNMFSWTGTNWMKIRNKEQENWILKVMAYGCIFNVLHLKSTNIGFSSFYGEQIYIVFKKTCFSFGVKGV